MNTKRDHRVQVYSDRDFINDVDAKWGWQCLTCGVESRLFATMFEAEDDAENHGRRL